MAGRIGRGCRGCGRTIFPPFNASRRCPSCAPRYEAETSAHWHATHNSAAQGRFRRAVLKRDGNRCRALLDDGTRCPATTQLVAHHLRPLREIPAEARYDASVGITLCRRHHASADPRAR